MLLRVSWFDDFSCAGQNGDLALFFLFSAFATSYEL